MDRKERIEEERKLLEEFRGPDGTLVPEIVLASGRAQVQNLSAIIAFVNESRRIIDEAREEVTRLTNNLQMANKDRAELRRQLSILQGRFYQAGTVQYAEDGSQKV